MEDNPADPEDDPPAETEKPRYLLPNGCKDLIDALRLQGKLPSEPPAKASPNPVDTNQSQPPSVEIRLTEIVGLAAGSPKNLPASVTISDPITIRELATALRLKPFHLIGSLMELNVFASMSSSLEFGTAAELCAHYGVVASKAA